MKENQIFNKAAENIKIEPTKKSWDHLETMLENQALKQENKNIRLNLKYIIGLAASFILLVGFYFSNQNNAVEKTPYELSFITFESGENDDPGIYDRSKIYALNEFAESRRKEALN